MELDINNSKEKLLIVGAGGLGRVTLEHTIRDYECSFIDDSKCIGEIINGVSIVGKVSDLPTLFREFKKIVISIGENNVRKKIYIKAKEIGYVFPNIICESAYISPFASIGEGCIFLNNVVIQNGSNVGNATILNPGVEVHHDSSVGSFCCIYTNSVVRTASYIDDSVKIGSNVTVCNKARIKSNEEIGDGVIVKA